MKKTILAVAALVALASCAKESSTTELIDPTAPVAATFASASITRVADNAWEENDKIGITMTTHDSFDAIAIDGTNPTEYYFNIPYTVVATNDAGDPFTTSGAFSADGTIIYFPVDNSSTVDFYAYYPYGSVDSNGNLAVSVADQSATDIDVVAAKVSNKSKSSATISFSGDDAFEHQLSKLTMTIKAGDGVGSLDGLVTTIKGQKTTAKFNIYSFAISGEDNVDNIEANTTTTTVSETSTTVSEAILLPTAAVDGSTIEFATTDGNVYILDISEIAFAKGEENKYEITLNRTGATITSSTINGWGTGASGSLDATEYEYEYGAATISATYVSSSQISVTIDNSAIISDATTYSQTIYRKAIDAIDYISSSTLGGTNIAITEVSADTEYEIYVLTVYADGTETKSNVLYITTLAAS